jgi:3-oxoacyl-[acyl-carrier protein] reductase
MARKLEGKTAIITGASRGMGAHIASQLASAGCNLALMARTASDLESVTADCQQHGVSVLPLLANLKDPESIAIGVERTISELGRLDILVNNAGIGISGPVEEIDPLAWEDMLAVNLRAPMLLTKHALPHIRRQAGGAVVFISSGAGRNPVPAHSGYCASKHGLEGFAKTLWNEVRDDGIKVSVIVPGSTNTSFHKGTSRDRSRMIQPEDIAAAVEFVLGFPDNACPREITIVPQRKP